VPPVGGRVRLSRPSFYQAAGALRPTACPGRCRPGRDLDGRTSSPRRWSRLAAAARAEDPSVRSGDVAVAIEETFGVRVHPRSVERALTRVRNPNSGGPG